MDIQWGTLLAPVIMAVLHLVLAAGVAAVIYLFHRYVKGHLAQLVASQAVNAVEVIAASSNADYTSKGKFTEALKRCRQLAARFGIKFTDEEWNTLIHGALGDLKAAGKEIKKQTINAPINPNTKLSGDASAKS